MKRLSAFAYDLAKEYNSLFSPSKTIVLPRLVKSPYKTYESRRRGYDVHATQSFENDILALANEPDLWTLVFNGAKMVMVEGHHPKTIEAKISQALKGYGPGSRVVIRYESKFGNEGHVFIGENIGGRVFFIDPQTNEFYGTEVFSGQKKNSFAYTRIDTLRFTDKIKFAVD